MKKYWKEIMNPKPDKKYWIVIDYDDLPHFFKTEKDAFEYSSWNFIEDGRVFQECHN